MTDKKIALVTGANRGLGFESSRQLAQSGFKVILTSRDETKGRRAADELIREGLDVLYAPLDVQSQASVDSLLSFLEGQLGRVDVLLNNAGVFLDSWDPQQSSILKVNLEDIRQTMESNVLGVIRLCQAIVPMMKRNHYGRIINVSSGMGQLSGMNGAFTAYRLSKTALNAVTCILADELKGDNILVNSLCPGWVKTDMGGANASREIKDGVGTAVWLASQPDGSKTGCFFRDNEQIDW
jgi:NAD(P)-dependent dehydrogenase (short-subunit alcohol dehydrogenase family)